MPDLLSDGPRGKKRRSWARIIWDFLEKWKTPIRLGASGLALTLGFYGYMREAAQDKSIGAGVIADNLYKTFQLLAAHMPDNYSVDLPWELQIARFAVPITALWLSVGTYLDHVRKPLHRLKVARARNHVIIVGASTRAEEIARQCSNADQLVVCILDHDKEVQATKLQSAGILVILGDLRATETFQRVRLHRAQSVVIATGDTVRNINVSAAVRAYTLAFRPEDTLPLTLVAEIEGAEMRALLEASFRRSRERRIEYRLFDGADNVARSLLPRLATMVARPGTPRVILLVGLDNLSEVILLKLIRNCPEGTCIVVALPQAQEARIALEARYPFLERLEMVEFVDVQPGPAVTASEALRRRLCEPRLGVIIVNVGSDSIDDNEKNLTTVIAMRRFARDRGLATPPMFVRLVGGSEALDALKLMHGENIDTSRIHAFGGLDEECDADNVLRSGLDALAMRVHERYLATGTLGPAAVPWHELDETFRTASRNQADHMVFKLARAQCRVRPADRKAVDFAFTGDEVEALARLEHWRWWMDRAVDGWTYGDQRSVGARTHPDMVPFDQLSERVRELDRIPIRNLPDLLSGVDRVLVREYRIGLSPVGDPDDVLVRLKKRIDVIRDQGAYPIVLLLLDDESGVKLAQKIADLKIVYEVNLIRPAAVLLGSFGGDDLMSIFDRAESVNFIWKCSEVAASGLVGDTLAIETLAQATDEVFA